MLGYLSVALLAAASTATASLSGSQTVTEHDYPSYSDRQQPPLLRPHLHLHLFQPQLRHRRSIHRRLHLWLLPQSLWFDRLSILFGYR
ncbi:hypothetical protein SAICODRAFT_30390 [Saitoella complicata NRRL Y-17804]|uniref:uncharacterized protein n=1 Tax=Saitoella complicata (strain BCRC 22490 / CBS 7301 / JCM 7358 / NBRC 10748 / NRRL Y-17804) TaxID=698492 RepID=UPI0008674CB4|nr:uncharacterized protein SAICODRAFT_30390 [Saitoella complicata NRRL Y-17804]ODQ52965.1 hypothetical protein SAICODRAFT_30390 [Saitoella complicata NRRL Y-17804]